MKKNNSVMFGAAVAANIMSVLSTLLSRKKEPQTWAAQARLFANSLVEKENRTKRNVILGSVAGGLIGVAAAVLMAQNSNPNLLKSIVKPFKKEVKKASTSAKKQVKSLAARTKKTIKTAKKKGKELKVETLKHFG